MRAESTEKSAEPATLYEETRPEDVFDDAPNRETESVTAPLTQPVPPSPTRPPVAGSESGDAKQIDGFDASAREEGRLSLYDLSSRPYLIYRGSDSGIVWLPGSGQQFGWLSFMGSVYQSRESKGGLGLLFNFHLLGGPESSPLPPRLFDFAASYQKRGSLSEQFSYDLAASAGIYSDFEASARDGVRFPSHAVGMVHVDDSTDFVFGVDYLDRDDIALLPVVGVSLRPADLPDVRLDFVFPRPRIDYVLSDEWRAYVAGRLDGGTWDIEYPREKGRVMTYRDLRLLVGFEHADGDGELTGWEFGYVFARQLEFRGQPATTDFDDAFVLQWFVRR